MLQPDWLPMKYSFLLQVGTGLPGLTPSHPFLPHAQKTSALWKLEQCCKTQGKFGFERKWGILGIPNSSLSL